MNDENGSGGSPRQLPLPGMEARRGLPFHVLTRPLVLLVIVGGATYFLLPQLATFERSTEVVRSLAWWAFGLAFLAQCGCYLAHAYALSAMLALFGERLSLARRLALTMAPYSLSLVWGGQLTSTGASVRWLTRAGVPPEAALVTGVLPAVVNLLSVVVVATIGITYLLAKQEVSRTVIFTLVVPVLIAIVLVALVGLLLRHQGIVVAGAHRTASFWARLRRRPYDPAVTDAAVQNLFDAGKLLMGGGWAKALGGDALSVFFDVLTLYCVFLAAGYHIDPGVLIAGYGLPILAGKLSVLPGGVGVIEGGMVAIYAAIGVPAGIVVVTILGYRLLSFWLPVLIGFALAVWLDRTLSP